VTAIIPFCFQTLPMEIFMKKLAILALVLASATVFAKDDPIINNPGDEPHAILDFTKPAGVEVMIVRPYNINDRNVSSQTNRRTYTVRPGRIYMKLGAGSAPVTGSSSMAGSVRSRRGSASGSNELTLDVEAGKRYRIAGRDMGGGSWEPYVVEVTDF